MQVGDAVRPPTPLQLSERLGAPVRVALAATAMFAVSMKALPVTWFLTGAPEKWRALPAESYYSLSYLSASYQNAGFIRRGLGGTLATWMSGSAGRGAVPFHILSALFLVAPIALIQWRLLRSSKLPSATFMMIFAILSPQLFTGWAQDVGRTDLFTIGTIAWAVWFTVAGRNIFTGVSLLLGFLMHETAIIFGLPLILACLAITGKADARTNAFHLITVAIAIFTSVAALALIQSLAAPSIRELADAMLRASPSPMDPWARDLRDCAIYMMAAGSRGLKTAMCYNLYSPGFIIVVICGIGATMLNGYILNLERRPWWFAATALAPMLFMNVVANDTGRWVKFACANAWMLSAVFQIQGLSVPSIKRTTINYALLAAALWLGSADVHHPNRASIMLISKLDLQPFGIANWMAHCDPDWYEIVYGFQK